MSAGSEAQQRLETLHSVAGSRLIDTLPDNKKDLSKQQREMLATKFRKTMVVHQMELRRVRRCGQDPSSRCGPDYDPAASRTPGAADESPR